MGTLNQFAWIERLAPELDGPFLEVGSKDYGSTQNLRPLLVGRGRYVGLDMEAGPGVDVVLDLTGRFDEIDRALGGQRFGTIVCLSVLEHCAQPFSMAENITRLLAPGGRLVVSVPFAWKFHGYPSDYWRFTHEGVRVLFPGLEFDLADGQAASSQAGSFAPLDENLGRISMSAAAHRQSGHFWRGVTATLLRQIARLGPLRWLAGYRYVMAPTEVMMVGIRRAAANERAA